MSDPFKAVHADLKKAVSALEQDARIKYKASESAQTESDTAVAAWQGAQKQLETFEVEVLGARVGRSNGAQTAIATKKKTAKKAKVKKVSKAKSKKVAKAKTKTKVTKAKAKSKGKKKVAKAKTKAKAKSKTSKTQSKKAAANAAAGRRAVARGDRPPLKQAIATVMGTKAMKAGDVLAGLESRGWVPHAGNPRQYLSYVLSSSDNWFERTENRGEYKVIPGAPVKAKTANGAKAKKAKSKSKKAPAQVDQKLGDLGLGGQNNVRPNPFSAS